MIVLALIALPSFAATPCVLEITVSCANGHCTSTTLNTGTNICTGEFLAAMFSEGPVTVSGFTTSLGLPTCFDSSTFPVEGAGAFAFCFGDAMLHPGASFTAQANVTASAGSTLPSIPILGLTSVSDADSGDSLGFVYAYNDITLPTCTPVVNVAPVTLSNVPYTVSWTTVSTQGTPFVVEESKTRDFAILTDSRTVQGTSTVFEHQVTVNTPFFYRVRAVQCGGGPGPNSVPAGIVVQVTPPATSRGTDAVLPFGSVEPFEFPLQVRLSGTSGKTALDGTTFTAKTDKPYLTVTPASGTIPANGNVNIAITAAPAGLPPGANTATVTLTSNTGTTANVPVSISLVTPVSPSGKSLPPGNALIIPVVTHVNGSGGPFQSDVRLTNTAGIQIKYQITYTPTQTDATTSSKSTTVPVDPGQSIALNDIVKDFFGVGATGDPSDAGAGALEIRPLNNSSALTYASSRTFVTTSKGTLGQFIAAIPFPQFATQATSIIPIPGQPASAPPILSLQQVAQSAKFRTNLGIVEGSGTPANGRIRIFNDAGDLLKEVPFSLRAGEHKQMNSFIATSGVATLDDGRIEIIVDSQTGAVSAYASVLDNVTTDPMAVMPVTASTPQATRYILPGMSELVSPFSNFHSDIRLFNRGTSDVTVTPVFYPQGGGSPVNGAPFTIKTSAVKSIDNALPTLFSQNGTGGSILFTTPGASSLVTTGRTFSNSDDGGTYGQFIPGVSPGQGIGLGDKPLQILQLEQSQNFRTNVGLAELSGNAAEVKVSLILPDSKTSPSTVVSLGANQFTQLNRIIEAMVGTGINVYNARVIVQVTSGSGRVTAYGSVIDNFTADPTYVPAQ